MTICKCRRCGALYESYDGLRVAENVMEANGIIFIRNARGNLVQTTPFSLCPKCMAELIDWWKGGINVQGS